MNSGPKAGTNARNASNAGNAGVNSSGTNANPSRPNQNSNGASSNPNNNGSKQSKVDNVEKSSKVVSIVIQVLVGLITSFIIYQVALYVMNIDKLVIDDKLDLAKKTRVMVVDGFIDASSKNTKFNTTMPLANNYLPVRPSVNIKGGAQFTYSFWMHKDANAEVANRILFLKGDEKRYNFTIKDNLNSKVPIVEKLNELMVYSPMLKFGNDGTSYEIKFNTLNRYDEVMRVERLTSPDSAYRNNLLTTLENTWHMITITFEDNIPISDFENGIVVKFYVNDVMYKVGRYASALKQNQGDLHLFPNGNSPISNVKMSNFAYFNYVLSEDEIRKLSLAGANTNPTATKATNSGANKPPVLSDYNKLDIYNV